jgi:Flp pilus assembly protein TadD
MALIDHLRRFFRAGDAQSDAPVGDGHAVDQVASSGPQHPGTRHLDLYRDAMACLERGDTKTAVAYLTEALEHCHDFAEAHLMLGQVFHARGQLDEASDCYLLAAHFREDLQPAHLKQGLLALDRGRYQDARGHLQRAIDLKPDDAVAHNALGAALLKLRMIDAAEASFRSALAFQPDLVNACSNLGYLLFREREQFEAGAAQIENALQVTPNDEAVLCNWTMVLQQQGRFDELLGLSDRLLAANPGLHEVRVNRALVLLTRGDYRRGWKDYETRKLLPPFVARASRLPEWGGERLAGKRLLVYAEQGIGDEILFASCLPDAIRLAGTCVIECSRKLETLFRRSFPAATVVAKKGRGLAEAGEMPAVNADVEIAAGSLPQYFRNDAGDFPRHAGYLAADASRVAYWKAHLAQLGQGLKVGISWHGGMQTTRRSLRSIPLERWLPVLRCEGACFVSLQYGDAAGGLARFEAASGITVHHWKEAIDDFDETAALVSALDLVITVQTAAAHLSGALGKNVWVLIPVVPEWRYQESGDTMPWYPSASLFRQPAAHDWAAVIERVRTRLEARISDHVARTDMPESQAVRGGRVRAPTAGMQDANWLDPDR